TVIEWLEIESFSGAGVDGVSIDAGGTNALLQNLLIYDFPAASTGINANQTVTVRNCILHDGSSGIVVTGGSGNATVENTTIYNMTLDGVEVALGNKLTMRNCIAVGSFVDVDLAGTVDYFGYNMYDQWSGQDPTGFNGYLQSPPAVLEDLFLSIAGPEDLHLETSGHAAGNAGIDLSSSFSNDIDNDTRTDAWDIGADEAIPGGVSGLRIIQWKETDPFP
ncbi:MAG: right-handed parallel beta-helix repeat-containing protein, partial [Planctomycetota bacterium]